MLVIRALEPADLAPDLRSRFANAFGGRRIEHDEAHRRFQYMGEEVRVREKVRIESPDPSLMAVLAKVGGLEHAVGMARCCLAVVMEEDVEEIEKESL